jgi:hypothetical protein
VAWRWANANIDKESLALLKQTKNISKEDMEDYNWAMFTHAMNFIKERMSLKKLIPKHFFINLLSNLSTEDLVTLGNLLSAKFMKPRKHFYATPSRRTWVPQELRNKMLKNPGNCWMIGPTLKLGG